MRIIDLKKEWKAFYTASSCRLAEHGSAPPGSADAPEGDAFGPPSGRGLPRQAPTRCARASCVRSTSALKAYDFTCRLLVTENTPATPLAATPATFLSISVATTPSRVTCPFSTMIRIGATAPATL